MRLTQRGELTLQRHCLRDESLSGKGAGGRGGLEDLTFPPITNPRQGPLLHGRLHAKYIISFL